MEADLPGTQSDEQTPVPDEAAAPANSSGWRRTESRAEVEWIPAAYEGVRVSRPVAADVADVARILRVGPEQAIQLAYGATPGINDGVVRLRLSDSLPWLSVPVRVESLTPRPEHHAVSISIRWRAARFERSFPVMEADLKVVPGSSGRAVLVLEGRYRPPLGLFGLLCDRLVGRRVASATAARFVERIADEMERDTFTRSE